MITAFYAAILALIFLTLSLYVISGRFRHQVALGDGGIDNMQKRIRAHANFAEYVPFALILMILAEMQNAPLWLAHAAGIVLVIGRLAHIGGILHPRTLNLWRPAGVILTLCVILYGAVWSLWMFGARLAIGA